MLRHLLFQAIRRIVADPRVQQKAAATYNKEVKPRIQEAGKFQEAGSSSQTNHNLTAGSCLLNPGKWAYVDSNHGPLRCDHSALTN